MRFLEMARGSRISDGIYLIGSHFWGSMPHCVARNHISSIMQHFAGKDKEQTYSGLNHGCEFMARLLYINGLTVFKVREGGSTALVVH